MYDVIILGGGAAGLGAALYSARYTLNTLLIAKEFGGTGLIAHKVDNWIGEPGIAGIPLMNKFVDHVKQYNVPMVQAEVKSIAKNDDKTFTVKADKTYKAKSIIYAFGMTHRKLNVKGEKEFSGKGVHYCYTCLLPDNNIITNPDSVKLQDINSGKVFTHKGKFRKFSEKVRVPYTGPVLSITPRLFGGETALTPEHRVLAIRRTWNHHKSVSERKKLNLDWIFASELNIGDYLAYPIPKETKDLEHLDLTKYVKGKDFDKDLIWEKNKTHSSKQINRYLDLNSDFLRVIGYYIAEGCTGHNGIVFHFNKKEVDYIKEVKNTIKNSFNVECKTIEVENVVKVYCYSKIVKEFFSLFGTYAHKKNLISELMYLPVEKQKEIIKGVWRGDGCKNKKHFCYVTNSPKLVHQLKLLLLRQGIVPTISKRSKEHLKPGMIDGRKIYFRHDKFHLYIGGPYLKKGSEILGLKHEIVGSRNRVLHYGWITKNYAFLPIKDINQNWYDGDVYDLTVPGDNSYTTENMCVHNCDGPIYKDKNVAVIGGSDSAGLGSLFLADYAKKVTILYRKDKLRAEPITTKQVYDNKKIKVIHNVNVKEFLGDKLLTKVKLDNGEELDFDGVFIEIGHIPLSNLAKKVGVKITEHGFIQVDRSQKTNVKGFAAAGDITTANTLKQFITSAAEGSVAAESVYNYIMQGKWAKRS